MEIEQMDLSSNCNKKSVIKNHCFFLFLNDDRPQKN